jgi:hypothetical protein
MTFNQLEMKGTKMNRTTSIFNAERAFLRSCLESAPQGAPQRNFNLWSGAQQRAPARLHVLKQKLLQTTLKRTALPHVQRQLCGAASLAAEMAWDTAAPLLLFPCLFEEMAANILLRFFLDEPIDDAGLAFPEENDPDPVLGNAETENDRSYPISEAEPVPA